MSALVLASAAIESAVAAGVREVVLCPGSRSAPLAYAALAAARAGHLRLHVRVDERSAGFLALGLGKTSRRPALVITTSGTAVANLHPAVLEAHHGSVPLAVLSADRPAALRGSGANQTTIQPGIFARAVRWEIDLDADAEPAAVGAAVARAVASAEGYPAGIADGPRGALGLGDALGLGGARGSGDALGLGDALGSGSVANSPDLDGHPGPVHVNLCLREPLAPASWPPDPRIAPIVPGTDQAYPVESAISGRRVRASPGQSAFADDATRTLLVVGDLVDPSTRPDVMRWAAALGLPVVAEPFGDHAGDAAPGDNAPEPGRSGHNPARSPTSLREIDTDTRDGGAGTPDPDAPGQAGDPGLRRVLPHGPLLLTDAEWLDANAPDRVLVAGRVTLSRPVMALMRRPGLRVDALTDTPVAPDPAGVVGASYPLADVLAGEGPDPESPRALATPPTPDPATHWFDGRTTWAAAWGAAGDRLAAAIAAEAPAWPTGLAVARALVDALRAQATPTYLFVGPSNPVRDLDLGVAGYPGHLTVVANRGLAGIDGCLSTAVGVALTEGTAYALVGDLTFLHDTNALLIGPGEPRPNLTIVVVNDGGGGIFRLLEPGAEELAEPFDRLFGTPIAADLLALCNAHGVPYAHAHTPEELSRLVATPPDGLRVVEVSIDPRTHRAAHDRLRAPAAADRAEAQAGSAPVAGDRSVRQ